MIIDIDDFHPKDQSAVENLIIAGLQDRWGDAFEPTYNNDICDIQSTYVDRNASVLVGWSGTHIIATGTLVPISDGTGEIVRMSTSAQHRRKGLGRIMVKALIERARNQGMATVNVATDTPWTSAIELYRSCGFTEIGQDETDTYFEMTLEAAVV
jgi:ribosomal protein S18 acetylase RimI-like enzyme